MKTNYYKGPNGMIVAYHGKLTFSALVPKIKGSKLVSNYCESRKMKIDVFSQFLGKYTTIVKALNLVERIMEDQTKGQIK